MRFKGKIDSWFWIVMLVGEGLVISTMLDGGKIFSIVAFVIYNLAFLPFVVRNYAEVTEEEMTIVFGFSRETMALSKILEIYRTNSALASSAASLDRIVIEGCEKKVICAVKDKEGFFTYLKEQNPNIKIDVDSKRSVSNKLERSVISFCLLVFVAVGALLVTGDIKIHYEADSFTIEATYWPDQEIAYKEVEEIEYRDEAISGTRIGGFGSFRLQMGSFRNDEFGNYTRYTYDQCDAGIVLKVNGKNLVLSGKDKESTKAVYEELLKHCGKE